MMDGLDRDTTVEQVLAMLDHADPERRRDIIGDVLRSCLPWVKTLAFDECMSHRFPWNTVGDDLVGAGLEAVHSFLGRLMGGWRPLKPDVKLRDAAWKGVRWKIRAWLDFNHGWADPWSGSARAWHRHKTCLVMVDEWQRTTGTRPDPHDPGRFLEWANTRLGYGPGSVKRLRPDDLTAPTPNRADLCEQDGPQNYDWETDSLSRAAMARAAKTAIAWADNEPDPVYPMAARFLLGQHACGQVCALPTASQLQTLAPHLSAAMARDMHAAITSKFRDLLVEALRP